MILQTLLQAAPLDTRGWKKNLWSLTRYLSVYPSVPAAMAGVYFIPTETAQLNPVKDK